MRSQFKRLVADERGAEAIDYVLVLGFVVIAAVVFMGALGVKIAARWREIVNALGMD